MSTSLKKILIIEDDDFLRSLIVIKLQSVGTFSVDAASDGKVGIDKITKNIPDLVILDLMLPVMNGFDVLRTLRTDSSTKNVPVIVFSNMSDDTDMKMCLDLGITDYMIKSNFTLDELVEKINMVLK